MPDYKLALIPGDGIGPEVVNEVVKVLKAIEDVSNIKFKADCSRIKKLLGSFVNGSSSSSYFWCISRINSKLDDRDRYLYINVR